MRPDQDQLTAPVSHPLADLERGFPTSRLEHQREPKVKHDERGFFIMTLSENIKVYFEDYYQFLEIIGGRCQADLDHLESGFAGISDAHSESLAYFRARRLIVDLVNRNVRSFYSDRHNLGVVMTPWCFGTVILEKVELMRDRISRGEVSNADVGDYPFDVVRYIDEIKTGVLMDIFEFPPKAFAMRWQYTELIKRYSSALSNVTTSLQNILELMKNYGK